MPILLLFGLLGLAGFCGFYIWGTSAYSYDLEGAKQIIADMEKAGGITDRSCRPNRAVMMESYWRSIPGDERKEKVLALLARICAAQNGDAQMTLVNERGIELARFNGWSMRRMDR